MNRMLRTILIAAVLFALPQNARAQSYGTELPFVLGTGARITGMGLAGVSLSGDASIQYYNPAGMSYLQWKQFVFFRSVLFESDALYHTASYSHPLLNYGTFGISLLRVDVGGIEERDSGNQLVTEDLHNSQTRILLGYSQHVTPSISAGFNVKLDNQAFGTYSGSGVGLDVGIQATQQFGSNQFIRGLRQGFAIHNLIEPAVKLDIEEVGDPMQVSGGVTVLSAFRGVFMETALDLVSPRYSPVKLQLGQEISYANNFSFRFGIDGTSPVYGLGAQYKSAALDYAYRPTDVGDNHLVSFSIRFGSSKSQMESRARSRLEKEVNEEINVRMRDLERRQIERTVQTGDSLYALGEFTRAQRSFESALLWQPDNEHAEEYLSKARYFELMREADVAVLREDYVQGIVLAKQALEIMPQDRNARQLIDTCNKRLAESRNSVELVNRMLKTSIDLYAAREFVKALAGFEELVRLNPNNQLAAEYRSKCLMQIDEIVRNHKRESQRLAKTGDYDSAIEHLKSALAYHPDDRVIKARILELDRARINAAQAAVSTTPQPSQPRTSTRLPVNNRELEEKYKRGMQHFNKGQFDHAVGLFMEVWSASPVFHDVAKLLTKSYLLIGMGAYSRDDYEAAIDAWKKALAIDPDNVKVKRYLARTDAEFRQSRVHDE